MARSIVVLLVLAAVFGLVLSLVRESLTAPLRINPHVHIDPSETYHIDVWVSVPTIPRRETYVQAVEKAVAVFTATWTSITVVTNFVPQPFLAAQLRAAKAEGKPPDVLVNSTRGGANYGALQVPLGLYLQGNEGEQWPQAIVAQLSVDGIIANLPIGYCFRVFAGNPNLFRAVGLDVERYARAGWTWDEFLAVVDKLSDSTSRRLTLTNVDLPLLLGVAASSGEPTPFDEGGRLLWSMTELQAMGDIVNRLAATLGRESLTAADEDALARFLSGQVGLIGPLSPELARWVALTAQKRGLTPSILPMPFVGSTPVVDIAAVSVALFRQAAFRGNRHTRAAAELAIFLSGALPPVLATHLALLAPAPGQDGLLHLNNHSVHAAYADLTLAPAAPHATYWETATGQPPWEESLYPAWQSLVAGELTAHAFAVAAHAALSQLARP